MNPVSVVDLVGFLAVLMALIILWRGWKRALGRDAKLLLAGLLALTLFRGFSNVLEWSGITQALDPFEDFIEILEPLLWCFFLYAFLQEIAEWDLRQSEERLRLVIQNMPVMMGAFDADWNVIAWNRECERVTGYSADEIVGNPKALELLCPDTAYRERMMAEWIERGDDYRNWEWEITCQDGSVKTVAWSNISKLFPIPGWATWGIGVDVTERKRAEEKLRKANRAYKVLSGCNQAVVRATEETALLHEICRLIVEVGGYRLAWIGFAEQDEGKSVRPVAQAGFEDGYLETLGITWADTERGRGPTGKAIRTGEPAIVKNILTDPDFAPWRETAIQRGYASSIALPLIAEGRPFDSAQGRPFGALNIYAVEPDAFGADEVKLLMELADDLAYGIVALRTRAERKRAEEALKLRMEQLAALSQVSQAVTASLELDDVLAEIVSLAGEVVASDYTSVVLVDETGHIGQSAENLPGVPTIEYRIRDEGLTSWIVRSRQAVVIDEIGEDGAISPDLGAGAPRTANPLIVEAGVKSVAGLPLVAKDRLLGVLYLHSLRPAAFRGQLPLLTTSANQVAIAIENARLYEEAKGHAAKLATLYETGKDITLILELDALLQLIAERSARLTGADKSLILLVDTEAEKLTKAVGFGFTPGQIESITYQEVQDGISGWVLRERTPTISEDVLTDPRNTGLALQTAKKEHERGRSIAVAPLLIKGEVIGTLTVINNVGKPAFSQDDLDLVVMLSSQAAIAIENARLYEAVQQELTERKRAEEALRRERDLARALEAAAAIVSSTLDLDQVLDRILEQVSRVVPNDAANIMLVEGDRARVARWRGYERFGAEEFVSTVAFRITEVPNLQRMVESKKPMVIPDTAAYPGWVRVPEQEWLRSYAAVPIIARDEVIGFLNVDSATPGFFTWAHAETLRAFASHATAAIENARLYESERRRRAELEALHQASLHLTSSLEQQPVMEAILDYTLKVMAADDAHIFLYDGERLAFGAALWADAHQQEPYAEPRPQGLTYTVARSGERIVVPDVNGHPFFQDYPWGGAIAGLPLRIGERVVGVMNVAFEKPHAFNEHELRVLGLLADQAAIAIENARLYEAVQQELSERKRAEEALKQSEEKYRTLVDNIQDGVFIIQDAEMRFVNEAFARMCGYTVEEVVGMDFRQLVAPEDLEIVADRYHRRQAGEDVPREYEFRMLHKDGTTRIFVNMNAGLVSYQGKVASIGTVKNITARKRLEEQLLQARKMEAVGMLAGGVAHDFNNILTAIIGYSELLLREINPYDPRHSDVKEIKKAADRAAALTAQLLAFSRRQILQPTVLDLNATVANMGKMLRRLIREDIDLLTVLDPALGRVKADPAQIEQVIVNLAVNARDAMPQGGKLTIETANVVLDEDYARRHAEVQPGAYVMLAVSDTGVGMDAETLSHIFEPFFTTKEVGKGTGMGLATVYGIVKQSEGHIWVYSEPGQGTTFKIYLPRIEEALESSKRVSIPAESLQGSETILLVEDEDVVREPVRRVLSQNGYTVLEARHGGEALQVCEQHEGPIHLLVTDVVMPRMSGRELAERLASLHPGMKVLYISGYTDNAIAHRGVLEPGTAFLQKPFTPYALALKVRQVLDAPQKE